MKDQAGHLVLGQPAVVGRGQLRDRVAALAFPVLAIFVAVLGYNLLGEGIRDALDPRQRAWTTRAFRSPHLRQAEDGRSVRAVTRTGDVRRKEGVRL